MKKCREGNFSKKGFLNLMFRDALHVCMHCPERAWDPQELESHMAVNCYVGLRTEPDPLRTASAHNYKLSFKALKKGNSYTPLVGILVLHRSYTNQYEIPNYIYHVIQLSPLLSIRTEVSKSGTMGLY